LIRKCSEIRIEPKSHPAPRAVSPLADALAPRMTNLQRMKVIESSIEELRPFLQRDGGDCELIDVEGDRVMVKLTGACVGCQLAAVTISGVQQKLIEKIGAPLRVIPIK
jgi:NifU-like protein